MNRIDLKRERELAHRERILSSCSQALVEQREDLTAPLSVVLNDIRSLWNVGSIFRTADGAGFKQIYLCGITGVPPRRQIEKVSLGAEHYLSWKYYKQAIDVLQRLKEAGAILVALEMTSDSQPFTNVIKELPKDKPICLIVGNEETGIDADILTLCNHVGHLPMAGIKGSLNVAVAFGVAAYFLAEELSTHIFRGI